MGKYLQEVLGDRTSASREVEKGSKLNVHT